LAADTASFTDPAATHVRLDGATDTGSNLSFGNGTGCTITNDSGDTAKINHSSKTITVNDAFTYGINLTNGGGSGTSATGAFGITSTTFNVAAGGRFILDGRYYGASGAVRTITKSTGTGTLELTGDFTNTFMQCSLSAGTLVLNGTGANSRLMGLGSVGSAGTLRFDSSNTNLFAGTTSFHANTGIRLISGLVDLNGNNVATTRIQGTATTGVVTNNGAADATLTLGNFGTTTGLAASVTNPVFNGIIQDGTTNKLGLTLTGGGGSLLTLTLGQTPTYTGATLVSNGATLITPGLAPASAVTVGAGSTLLVDGPLANTAGVTVAGGNLDSRGAFSAGALTISGGTLKLAPSAIANSPIDSLDQSGGTIELDVSGATADKLSSAGNMKFSGGNLAVQLRSAPTAPVVLAEYGSLTGTPTVTLSPDLATTRLSSPVVDPITGNKITLSLSGSVADLVWTGAASSLWNLADVNWNNGGSGSAFFNLDRVTFPDGSSSTTIDLTATVIPGKMTFSSTGTNDYIINGTGGIGGLGEGLVKNGDAWLNLGGVNTFTGPVQLNNGVLNLLTPQALGSTSGVTVASTLTEAGQLDLKSMALTDAGRSFSATISGDGPAGAPNVGAIVSSGSTSLIAAGTRKSGIRNLTLAANASVGGSGTGGSFDIGTGGSVNGGGFTLTKTGTNEVLINGPVTNLHTVVESGTLSTGVSEGFGATLLVKSGAVASSSSPSGAYVHTTNVTVESGATIQSGTSCAWNGSFVAEGNLAINIDQVSSAIMSFPNGLTVPGDLTRGGAASGGTSSIAGDLNVTGSITLSAGVLTLDGSGGSLNASNIVLSGATSSFNFNRATNLSFPNVISGPGALKQTGGGTTILGGNNSYSGVTTVSAGTLLVNGDHTGTGNVLVSAGASLGGTGKMPGAVTATGTLAPGNAAIGSFTTGSAAKTTTINGTLRIETDGAASRATDVLVAEGSLTLGAASIVDFDSIGPAPTLPYYVIASYVGSLSGAFATETDLPSGYSLVYDYDNGVSATNIALVRTAPATPFETWIAGYYPGSSNISQIGPDADPDGDGQSNVMEFALGGIPNDGTSNAKVYPLSADSDDVGTDREMLLTIAVRGGTPVFAGTPSPSSVLAGITCTIQGTADLSAFSTPVSVVAPVTAGLPSAPAGYEYRTFSLDGSNGLPARGFLRVQVTH
jgi:autotransporter-associated beta strand protein